MGSSSDTVSLAQLDALVQSAQTLIQDLLASTRSLADPSQATTPAPSISAPQPPQPPSSSSPPPPPSQQPAAAAAAASPDPLALARDSATLIRANVTKLSLLIINEPFTPSAIASLLGSPLLRPLLALLSAVHSCEPSAYTLSFRQDLAYRAQRLLSELAGFLAKIPADGKALTGAQRDSAGSGSGSERGSIPATALVWSACDGVAALADLGVAGFLAHRIAEWKDTLDDIMQELKEWSEQDPDDDDDDSNDDHDEGSAGFDQGDTAQRLLDDLMAQKAIPADDPDAIRPRLTAALRNLRMVVLLYQAIVKRRIKKLPPLPWPAAGHDNTHPTIAQQLDRAVALLGKLPDSFGDLAATFYDMRGPAIDEAMAQCCEDAASASELLAKNWTGAADEFTQWADKFRSEIRKT